MDLNNEVAKFLPLRPVQTGHSLRLSLYTPGCETPLSALFVKTSYSIAQRNAAGRRLRPEQKAR